MVSTIHRITENIGYKYKKGGDIISKLDNENIYLIPHLTPPEPTTHVTSIPTNYYYTVVF